MTMSRLSVAPLMLCLAACDVPEPTHGSVRNVDWTDPVPGAKTVRFEGRILRRLKSPRVWCGIVATRQGVEVELLRCIEGKAPCIVGGKVVVYYLLVGPPQTEKDDPILNLKTFGVGQHLSIHAYQDKLSHWHSCSE